MSNAANLMLDFGPTAVGSSYATLSPGHLVIPVSQTAWNTISASSARSNLVFADGTAAGVTLTMGQEGTGGTNKIINYETAITSIALAGTGGSSPGTPAPQVMTADANSIYAGTAAGRDGFFGSGTSGAMPSTVGTGQAIGLRIDGLQAGDYLIYVMARNTNTNVNSTTNPTPMNVYATTGGLSTTFDFSALSPTVQSNLTYPNTNPTAYNTFINGENYVSISVSLALGQSLFIASEGGNNLQEARGFLNMVQIVQVPEPSAALLGMLGMFAFFRRRR